MRSFGFSLTLLTVLFTVGFSGQLGAQVTCPKTHVFDMGTIHFYNTIQCSSNGSGGCTETNTAAAYGYDREPVLGELGCKFVAGACECNSPILPTISIEFLGSAAVFDKDDIPRARTTGGGRGCRIRYLQTVRCQNDTGVWVYYLLMTANHPDPYSGAAHWPGIGKRFAFTLDGKPTRAGSFDYPRAKREKNTVRFGLKDFSVVGRYTAKPQE